MSDPDLIRNPAIIEAAARALHDNENDKTWAEDGDEQVHEWYRNRYRDQVRVVLAAVTPLIRAAALEEAAQVADGWLTIFAGRDPEFVTSQKWASDAVSDIADGIRALKEQP